jgi:2-polyprenyl-6-methoxyphenol hydroxylase-like FAD-dependent oxidoreductase
MAEPEDAEVLIIGAGPVGLLAALRLAELGVRVKIIDEEWRTAAHSYACALHPRSLQLLDRLGLGPATLDPGHRVETVALYEGPARRAEVRLGALPVEFPYVLVLPQSELEGLLEQTLRQRWGVKVLWNHRLSDLRADANSVVVTIDKLGGTAKGHIVPRWDLVVKRRYESRVAFVIGADGHESWVRQHLGIGLASAGAAEVYAVHEFESDHSLGHELRVALAPRSINVLWPLPEGRCRWSCQLAGGIGFEGFPAKGRSPVRLYDEAIDRATRESVARLVRDRAPWFTAPIGELHWSSEVQFERQMAREFGRGRCWLVGDAAHQTGPAGVQSLNVGLREADDLAGRLTTILRDEKARGLLETYDQERRREWRALLGLAGPLRPRTEASAWVAAHGTTILSCLPASGAELVRLLDQLGLALAEEGTGASD